MSQKFLSDVTLSTVTGGSMLKLDANGKIVAAVDGTDYISTSASSLWSTASGGIFYSDDVRIGTYQADVAPDAKLHIFDYQTTTPKLLIEDGNTGDASMEFKISTQSFTMGIDNSDSDKFVIAASGGLGTSNVLEIATSGLSAFQNSVLVKGSLFINNQEQIQQGATEKIASFQNLGTERGYFEVTDIGKGYFYADGFKTGATTVGFLKSDGSVDTSSYATSADINSFIEIGDVATYLSTNSYLTQSAGDSRYATAAQGALADSALQSLPTHYHDGRYYTKTESDNKYAVNGNNLVPINATDSNYQIFTEEVILATVNEYRGLAFPNGGRNFVFEVSIKGNISANHQGIFWGLNTLESIYNNNESGYKLTHQGEGQFHIRDIATNANQATSQDVLYAPNDGQYHRYKIISYTDPSNSNKAFFKVYVDGTLIFNAPQFAAPPQVPTYFGFINYTGDVTFSNWNVREITGEDELALLYGDGVFQPAGNYLTSLPAHHHDARYYTETEMDGFLAGKLSTSGKAADSNLLDGIDSSGFIRDFGTSAQANINTIGVTSGKYRWNSSTVGRPAEPQANEYGTLLHLNYDANIATQLAYDIAESNLYIRHLTTSTDTASTWKRLLTTSDSSSFDAAGSAAAEAGAVQDNLDSLAGSLGTAAYTASTDYAAASHTHSEYLTSVPAEYLTQTEGDARYYRPAANALVLGAKGDDIGGSRGYVTGGGGDSSLEAILANVALNFESASDEPSTIYFKSGVNAPSDFAYISFLPNKAGISEEAVLQIGVENDGAGSSDYIRLQGRVSTVVDYVSSEATVIQDWVYQGTQKAYIDTSGNLQLDGGITANGYNKSNWDTAYGWGNHASAGYLTSLPAHNHDTLYDSLGSANAVNARIDNEVFPAINDLGNAIPTNNNQLTNGAGYITSFDITTQTDGKYLRSNADDSFSGNLTSAQSKWIKFYHPTQTDSNDGKIGAGVFDTGLNIVGVQTVAGTGRQVRVWGDLITSTGVKYATESYVNTAVSNLVDTAPATLNTLNELAAALGDDANFSTTVANNIGAIDTRINDEVIPYIASVETTANAALPKAGGIVSGQVIFPSAATTKPVLPNGFISRNDLNDTTGRHDIWGISERYYPSNTTAGDAWGIQWSGTPNDIVFVGGGQDKVTISLDEGNITTLGTISASGYNKTNWDTAYSWGNHASAGYLTSIPSTYATDAEVNTAVGAIDTRINDEVIPYIADVETTANSALPKSGGTMTGDLQWDTSAATINTHAKITFGQSPSPDGSLNGLGAVANYGADGYGLLLHVGYGDSDNGGIKITDDGVIVWGASDENVFTVIDEDSRTERFRIDNSGNITASGTLTASGYNNTNWDTAYSWGNHAGLYDAAGSAAAVNERIDTEVFDAIGAAQATADAALPKAGGTVTGALTITNAATGLLVDSAGHASVRLDRGSTSHDANLLFYTAGVLNWRMWMDGDDDYLYIRDEVSGNNMMTFRRNYGATINKNFYVGTDGGGANIIQSAVAGWGDVLKVRRGGLDKWALQDVNGHAQITAKLYTTNDIISQGSSVYATGGTSNGKNIRMYVNDSWAYLTTNVGKYYLNAEVRVDGGKIGSYNEPLELATSGTTRVVVEDSVGHMFPVTDRTQWLGLDTNRWQIVFCEILDSAGQHEKNLQNPEGEKSVGEYETGTVLVWKGGKNVPCTTAADHMRMGIAVKGIDSPLIQGAEPVLVTGSVNEGDYLVTSTKEGHAEAISPEFMRQHNLFDCVLGKALESAEGESHLVKTWINI